MTDIVIVGGGPGGYAAALYARNFGMDVTLVEKERPGGTCLIRGCIPAKQWLHVADVFRTVLRASEFGVNAGTPVVDWTGALIRKNSTVEGLVTGLGGLLKSRDVDVIKGFGRLAGGGRVHVNTDQGRQTVSGGAVILASGSHARTIPGYEIDGDKIVTSDHALDWDSQPRRVGIIGGGVIGCEFASYLVDLGSEVHVFEMMDQILPGTDGETARFVQRQLQRRGVKFHIGASVGPAEIDGPVTIPAQDERIDVDVALVSVGRGPNTKGVGLENTGAILDGGFVETDLDTMKTAEPGLYAVGDIVAGTPQLAHVAFSEAIAAVTHVATGTIHPVDYDSIPRVTYTHPEVAEVGISEKRATALGLDVSTTKHAFNGVGRAIITGQNQGYVKVVARKDGPIVGATVVGPQAGEMIHELMYLVAWEASAREAAALIHAHPTLSETIGETLMSATGKSLH